MTHPYQLFDVVELIHGIPKEGIAPGTRATIIDIHTAPTPGYEIEVVDAESGQTLWWGSAGPEDIRPGT